MLKTTITEAGTKNNRKGRKMTKKEKELINMRERLHREVIAALEVDRVCGRKPSAERAAGHVRRIAAQRWRLPLANILAEPDAESGRVNVEIDTENGTIQMVL